MSEVVIRGGVRELDGPTAIIGVDEQLPGPDAGKRVRVNNNFIQQGYNNTCDVEMRQLPPFARRRGHPLPREG